MTGAVLFLVPARGGSRRIPGKNLAPVAGIPLVGWAVRTGRAAADTLGASSGGRHRVVCSTDDPDIAVAAAAWGAEVLDRPPSLATDDATSVDVALHALEALGATGAEFETVVLLQPTSPLTDAIDVAAAIRLHRDAGGRSVASVVAGHPAAWHQRADREGHLTPTAATDGGLLLTGGFYVVAPDDLARARAFVQPGVTLGAIVRPEVAVDVDEPHDLVIAAAMLAARPIRPVPMGTRRIGGGGRVFVIAEGGVNHNGDPALAARLVDAAAQAGADAVKFQTFDPAALAAAGAPMAAYQKAAGVTAGDQREMLAALALPPWAWADLQRRAEAQGLDFMSTPFDDGSAELLDRLGVPAFKVGSGELTNTPFIGRLAARGRPLLISTGMGDMVEVAAAVDAVRLNGDVPLGLFQCVSSYPARAEDANLRTIETMRHAFGVPVGWSDHTPGIEMALAAVAAGASIVEKHITLDRQLPGPDHRASLEPEAFAAMVVGIRTVEAALGTGVKVPVDAERDAAAVARRSLHWAVTLPAGTTIDPAHLAILRPGNGMRPSLLHELLGRRTARAVLAGTAVRAVDVEGLG